MKVKTTVHIYYCKFDWDAESKFEVLSFKVDDDNYRTYVGEQEIEIACLMTMTHGHSKLPPLEKKKARVSWLSIKRL
jgi:hypothetical protein